MTYVTRNERKSWSWVVLCSATRPYYHQLQKLVSLTCTIIINGRDCHVDTCFSPTSIPVIGLTRGDRSCALPSAMTLKPPRGGALLSDWGVPKNGSFSSSPRLMGEGSCRPVLPNIAGTFPDAVLNRLVPENRRLGIRRELPLTIRWRCFRR